jgi:nicotinate-nucleotide adenylyltransferase
VDLAALEARLPTLRRRLVLLEGPRFDVSGTELRERVRLGLPIRYQVPDAVLAYIAQHGLYRDE